MTRLFLSLYDRLVRRRWLAALLLLGCMGCCLLALSHLSYQEDIAEFLPRDGKHATYTSLYEHIGGQKRITVLFTDTARDTGNTRETDRLKDAMDTFGALWAATDSLHTVTDMQVRIDEGAILEMMDFIERNYPFFLTDADYARMDSLLATPDYLSRRLASNKELLVLPTGGILTQSIRHDPLQLFAPVRQRLQRLQPGSSYSVSDGYILTADGHRGLLFFTSPYGISESKRNGALADLLAGVMRETERRHPSVQISAVGAPLIAVTNARQIKTDSTLAVSLAVVLILALLLLAFRRLSDLLWIGCSILFGACFALGGMALYSDAVSIIVLGIGSVMIGIAVNYPLHYLDHLKHAGDKRQALKEMVPPLLIGNITTVSAFLCLVGLDTPAMRDLGVFASLILIGTILFVLVFLPLFARSRKHVARAEEKLTFGRFASFPLERKRWLFIPLVVVTLVLGWFSLHTSFDADIRHINYMTPQQQADLSFLTGSLQQTDRTTLFAVAQGADMEEALQANEALQRLLPTNDSIADVSGIGSFLPSQARQAALIARWQAFVGKHREALLHTLPQAGIRQGFAPDAFDAFRELLTRTYTPQPVAYFEPIVRNVGSYISTDDSHTYIANLLHVPTGIEADVKQTLRQETDTRNYIFDGSDMGNQLVRVLSDNFNYIGYACGAIVFFFLWCSFGRLELSLISFLPLAVSWVWILGIMELAGIRFNIVNIILATFIFGQGDDYTIFMTEGLMYEYTYRRKLLASYKNSVALSALIMFIGIGTLIIARHPALRSLAEVTVIGMFTVVLMAYYLPPLLFRRITTLHGEVRQVPLTLKRIGYSLFSITYFLIGSALMRLVMLFYTRVGRDTERKRLRFHRWLQAISAFTMRHIPGVRFSLDNRVGERFDRPAVLICNHQSHFDLMCLMMLTPRLVLLTNDWVWKNPFYGFIIRYAEFHPITDGIEQNLGKLQALTARGYSVALFPEGTRSPDCSILRFHQGAFYLAERLGLDVLPVFIHGAGHVLPKKDFMLREGAIHVEVCRRVPADDPAMGTTVKERTAAFRRFYIRHFDELRNKLETAAYFLPYVRYKYMYKGSATEARCRRTLRRQSEWQAHIDRPYPAEVRAVRIDHSGQGELAWLFALVHRDIEVYACEADEELHLLAANTSDIPRNLHFCHLPAAGEESGGGTAALRFSIVNLQSPMPHE
ncbi:MAG: 1-acyl-sn-glycerol-3-phosphate acyltransferase [Prevotellaceae bacterium]|jgi:1-acyl-sn-glycerol-3-phosphate acyltransferase|nr:1-acyl-sn-glycerol-3-phosphate acyltransferase [Prevotellaceae bacterium]